MGVSAWQKLAFSLLVAILFQGLHAQKTQSIRGTVTDKHTGVPLIGATVVLLDHEPVLGTITDHQGDYHLDGVPVGRRGIRVGYMGYHQAVYR